MTRARLIAVALFAALPLAGCGNKGPLILNPEPQEMPEGMAASTASVAPSSSATVMPAPAATVAPPSATTTAPPADTDGTPGTPR
ncbi:LPS translocon maturation chaperone LptM [Noviluteimonas gilva]|uniref:Sugar transporter n=1 Tax=Noviluteimonas gilva TaxID=2682097 RepID=A0A7C9LKC7_9GAMM|nr:lipoprotein [Lysobacter gilvus]MUV13424.1 sugar transporter [Lysobacter gilvus]